MTLKQEVRYEFFVFTENTTIDLYNPASVTFINTSIFTDDLVTINNVINLQSLPDNAGSLPKFQNQLILNNNPEEIDLTQYTIKFNPRNDQNNLTVICKYFVK
jgi:hypothetical protein